MAAAVVSYLNSTITSESVTVNSEYIITVPASPLYVTIIPPGGLWEIFYPPSSIIALISCEMH